MKKSHHSAHKEVSHETAVLEFGSKEFVHHDKNQFWYVGISLLLLVAIYLALKYSDYLLALVVVAVGIALFRLSGLKPAHKSVKITDKGIYWGHDFFGFHQLRSFWVTDSGNQTMIYLERLNLLPTISFDIPDQHLEKIIDYLSEQLPHHYHKTEPVTDRFARFFKV